MKDSSYFINNSSELVLKCQKKYKCTDSRHKIYTGTSIKPVYKAASMTCLLHVNVTGNEMNGIIGNICINTIHTEWYRYFQITTDTV